jgi:large subunit ribosomal protein L22
MHSRAIRLISSSAIEVKAWAKHVPMSNKKIGDVHPGIMSRQADEAVQLLRFIPRKSARLVEQLSSARSHLRYVKEAAAEKSTVCQRSMSLSRGSADAIRNRASHNGIALAHHIAYLMRQNGNPIGLRSFVRRNWSSRCHAAKRASLFGKRRL